MAEKKPKQVLVTHRVRPTLLKFERTIPFNATLADLSAHEREAKLIAAVINETWMMLARDHSIIVVVEPTIEAAQDIEKASAKTVIRAAFILAEGQDPGIVKAAQKVDLGAEFVYDALHEASTDTVVGIITPEGRK